MFAAAFDELRRESAGRVCSEDKRGVSGEKEGAKGRSQEGRGVAPAARHGHGRPEGWRESVVGVSKCSPARLTAGHLPPRPRRPPPGQAAACTYLQPH